MDCRLRSHYGLWSFTSSPGSISLDHAKLIKELAVMVARHRAGDTQVSFTDDQILTKEDIRFTLTLLWLAAPLYPLPNDDLLFGGLSLE